MGSGASRPPPTLAPRDGKSAEVKIPEGSKTTQHCSLSDDGHGDSDGSVDDGDEMSVEAKMEAVGIIPNSNRVVIPSDSTTDPVVHISLPSPEQPKSKILSLFGSGNDDTVATMSTGNSSILSFGQDISRAVAVSNELHRTLHPPCCADVLCA